MKASTSGSRRIASHMIIAVVCFAVGAIAGTTVVSGQVKAKVKLIGGGFNEILIKKLTDVLETVLLEMNRIQKGKGEIQALRPLFHEDAFIVLKDYVDQNHPTTARKEYKPQMIERLNGEFYDVRSILVNIDLGGTAASQLQSLIFTFDRNGIINSVRSMLPNYDYQTVIAEGESAIDSASRGLVLDFLEQFRMAYNTKNIDYLEQVYSEDALIIVGSVLKQKADTDMMKMSGLSDQKIRLVQLTKRGYLDGLKKNAFVKNAFLNVQFEEVSIVKHKKVEQLYGVSCKQYWNSTNYSDQGYLFLMLDYRDTLNPIIHVRSWQPQAFDDGTYVSLGDFKIIDK